MTDHATYVKDFLPNLLELNSKGYLKSRESTKLEYKLAFNWNDAEEYSRTMIAFANNQGGFILFGIKNQPREIVGLQSNNFEETDPEKVTTFLRSAFSGVPDFEYEIYERDDKKVGWIYTYPYKQKPIVCIRNGSRCLKDGAVYYRYPARTDVISSSDLIKLLDDRRMQEQERWMNLMKTMSVTGSENTAILNLESGAISGPAGGTVLIDDESLEKIQFIKEGEFDEKQGAPTLKLVGEIKSATRVVNHVIDPDLKYKLIPKEVGLQLGFNSGSAANNASALLKYYGLRGTEYMRPSTYGKVKTYKYDPIVVEILKSKIEDGQFDPSDPHSKKMKEIRRKARLME
jgi:hypothetical protein